MEFCKKCGCVMINKDSGSGCPRCGQESNNKVNLETSEKIETKSEVVVVDSESEGVNPITENECPKCKNKEAYFWILQTRSSDEAPTRFFKCTKCKHTWREYR